MSPPRDYPVEVQHESASDDAPRDEPVTIAAILDRYAAALPITDAMIREACIQIDTVEAVPSS